MIVSKRLLGCLCLGLIYLSGCGSSHSSGTQQSGHANEKKESHGHDDHGHDDHKHDDAEHGDHDHADHKDDDHHHAEAGNKGETGKHDDHDHAHDKSEAAPATYAAAVEEIEHLRKTIKEHFDAKKLKEADDAVHEVGHVLETVTKLAAKASLPAEDLELVKKHVEELFTAFGKIDEKLHGGQGSDYNDVAKEIEAAVEALKSKVKSEVEAKSEAAEKPAEDQKHSESTSPEKPEENTPEK